MCEHRMTVQRGQCGFLSSTELRPPILLAKSSLVRNYGFYSSVFLVNTPWKIKVWNPKNQGLESMMFRIEDWVKISWCQFSRVYLGTVWGSCAVAPAFNLYQEVGHWHMAKKHNNVGTIELYCSSIPWRYKFPDHIHSPVSQYAIGFGHPKTSLLYRELEFNSTLLKHLTKWYITFQKSGRFRRLPFHDSRQILCESKDASPALKSCTPR